MTLRARIVVFVNPVAEAHQPKGSSFVLGAFDVFGNALDCADFLQACSGRLRWRRHAPGPRARRCQRRCRQTGWRPMEPASRTVEVEAFCSWSAWRMKIRSMARARTGLTSILLGLDGEAHAQEIRRRSRDRVARIDERLTDRIFVGHRRDRRHLGDHAQRMAMHPLHADRLMSVES